MNRITSLKVGAMDVPVEFDKDTELCGEYTSMEGPKITTGPPAGAPGTPGYATTVFHELLHCICDLYHLKLKERQVRAIEQQVAAVFRDNPDFAALYFLSVCDRNEEERTR